MDEWNNQGAHDWMKNMSIVKERVTNDLSFEYKQAEKYNTIVKQKKYESSMDVYDRIADFEMRQKSLSPVPAPKYFAARANTEMKVYDTEKTH